MKEKKDFVIIDGKMIEVVMHETIMGEYVALANYPKWQLCGTYVDKDPKIAFFGSIDRLIAAKK